MRFYDLLIETNRELVGEPDPGGNVDRSRFGYGKRYNGELSARSLSDPYGLRCNWFLSVFSLISIQGTVSVISDEITLNCRLINSFY